MSSLRQLLTVRSVQEGPTIWHPLERKISFLFVHVYLFFSFFAICIFSFYSYYFWFIRISPIRLLLSAFFYPHFSIRIRHPQVSGPRLQTPCMILMFHFVNTGTFITWVSKTDHHFTLLNQVLLATDYATFQLLYNWTNNFENIKEMYKQFCFRLLILKFEGWCSLSRNTTPCLLTLPPCML